MSKTLPRYIVKERAYAKVQAAIKAGLLVRPDACTRCGSSGKLHAHHEDHEKPLEVIWVCPPCHGALHRAKVGARPELINEVLRDYDVRTVRIKRKMQLSKRELQVAKLVCLGLRNREIAEYAKIGVRTAETHRERIFRFTQSTNAPQLIGWMLKQNLITTKELVARLS